jgi:excisionase family DNA binding protein
MTIRAHHPRKARSPWVVLTIEERSVDLTVANRTLYKLSQEGRVTPQKVGRRWRFWKDAINRWLEGPNAAKEASRRPG